MILNSNLQLRVYDTLKDHILTGKLEKDTLYSETKLANEFGISRTPIREALHCLSQDGYIDIIPSKGFIIRQLNEHDMKESIQLRCAIEGFCTHLIASEIESDKAQALLDELENNLMMQERSLSPVVLLDDFMEYDHQFHLSLVKYAGNHEFLLAFQRSMYQIHLTSTIALSFSERITGTLNEHKQFFQYLKEKKEEAAYQILIAHLMMPLKMNLLNNQTSGPLN